MSRATGRPGRRRAAVLAIVLSGLIAGTSVAAPPAAAATRKERRFHRMVNVVRYRTGVSKLRLQPRLVRIAHRHSRRMANAGTLFHGNLSGILSGLRVRAVAENVGAGRSLRQVRRAFLSSPPHRTNMLRSGWRRTGVGVVSRGGRVWITQIFV